MTWSLIVHDSSCPQEPMHCKVSWILKRKELCSMYVTSSLLQHPHPRCTHACMICVLVRQLICITIHFKLRAVGCIMWQSASASYDSHFQWCLFSRIAIVSLPGAFLKVHKRCCCNLAFLYYSIFVIECT